MQITLLFWVCKTHTLILNGIVFLLILELVNSQFFSRNQMETWQENENWFLAWFGEFKVHFCKIIDVWTVHIQKKNVWTEFINGIEGMNVC